MTSFGLKIIACVTMFIDHLGYALYGKLTWLNYIGRIAFPIFAYQITEGYRHTKDLKKYFIRLIAFAVISQIPFSLLHGIVSKSFSLNVMFTLCMGLFCIWIWNTNKNKFLSLCFIGICCTIAEVTKMDYGYWGVLLVFVFYLFKDNKLGTALTFLGMVIFKYSISIALNGFYYVHIYLFLGTLAAIIPILLYNGKKGINAKYIIYLFYPVHLIILYLLHIFIK